MPCMPFFLGFSFLQTKECLVPALFPGGIAFAVLFLRTLVAIVASLIRELALDVTGEKLYWNFGATLE